MQDSDTLILEIFRQADTLKMCLFEQAQLASTLRHYSQISVSFIEIDKLCQEVVAILNKVNKKSAIEQDLIAGLTKFGGLLWENLLTRPVKDKLKSHGLADLILCIDEELINIPWELLYDGKNFLSLNFNLGRVVRAKGEITPLQYRSFSSTIKMLILANPTDDLKSAYQEGVNIRNQFDRKSNNVHIDFKSTSIDKLYVKKHFCEYDIVHFAGHCEHDAANPENSGWALSDARFSVADILNMGSTASLPTLVFSNACSSAGAPGGLIELDYQERHYNLASAFLVSGVRHYIGAIRRIEDEVSLDFAREFYAQLISGKSVGESVRASRVRLIKDYGLSAIHWASYLLYGDPHFTVFRPRVKQPRHGLKKFIRGHKKQLAWLSLMAAIIPLCIYLYMHLPTASPSAYFLYLESKKLYQRGDNQEALLAGERAIKKDPLFLATYPLLADTYQRLGDKKNALKYYFDYILYSQKRQDEKSLSSAYIGIGWFHYLEGDYPEAFGFYNKAISLSRRVKDKLNEATALRKLAVWHIDKGDYGLALQLLTKSSEINRQRQYSFEHRYNLACDYFDIGLVFSNQDDFAAAKEFYQKSRALFERLKLKNELSDYYFNLGEICLFEKEYPQALDYYLAGLKIDLAQDNKINLAGDYNMIGELYVEMDDLAKAEDSFNRGLAVSKQINNLPESATAYYNLGLLYKKKGRKNKVREYWRCAQEIYCSIDIAAYEEIKKELLDLNGG